MLLELPSPEVYAGTEITVKKKNTAHAVSVTAGGNAIDDTDMISLSSGNMGGASFISDGSQWYTGYTEDAIENFDSEANLILYFDFDEDQGSSPIDRSASGLNVRNNSGEYISSGEVVSGMMAFDSGEKFVVDHDDMLRPLDGFAYSFWFKQTVALSGGNNINLVNKSKAILAQIKEDGGNNVLRSAFYVDDGNGNFRTLTNVGLNEWYHFAFVDTGSSNTMKAYLNGALILNEVYGGNHMGAEEDNNINIGFTGNSTVGEVSMDEFRFYDRALSPDEVMQLANPDLQLGLNRVD
jgi:hypothetical protein